MNPGQAQDPSGEKLFHNLHRLAAAAGNYLPGLDVDYFVADRTVNVTFLFCPVHADQAAF
jgi:hypothetical protein